MAKLIISWLIPLFLVLVAVVLLLVRPAAYPDHGLWASYFENREWQDQPSLRVKVRDWSISMDGNRVSSNHTNYSVRFAGILHAPVHGSYSFMLDSDDGSTLTIDEVRVVKNSGVHGRKRKTGTVTLGAGEHRIKIDYFQGVGESFLKVYLRHPGEKEYSVLPLSMVTPEPASVVHATLTAQAHLSRTIIHAIVILLLVLAMLLIVWSQRDPIMAFLTSPGAPLGRLFRRPIIHDLLCVLACLGF